MNSMIIKHSVTRHDFFICPSCKASYEREDKDKLSDNFYSELDARDQGWVKTASITFCDPSRDYVWICPNCVKKLSIKDSKK